MAELSMRESIETLRKFTPRLNDLSDRANKTVNEVETLLNESLSVGIPVEEGFSPAGALKYERYVDSFRIIVCWEEDDGHGYARPWVECGRELKMASVRALPGLLRKLAAEV